MNIVMSEMREQSRAVHLDESSQFSLIQYFPESVVMKRGWILGKWKSFVTATVPVLFWEFPAIYMAFLFADTHDPLPRMSTRPSQVFSHVLFPSLFWTLCQINNLLDLFQTNLPYRTVHDNTIPRSENPT